MKLKLTNGKTVNQAIGNYYHGQQADSITLYKEDLDYILFRYSHAPRQTIEYLYHLSIVLTKKHCDA